MKFVRAQYHVHWGDLILMVLRLFHSGVSCAVVVLTCSVMRGCVYVWVFC